MIIKFNISVLVTVLIYLIQGVLNAGQIIVTLRNMHIEKVNPELCHLTAGIKFYNRTTKLSHMTVLFKKDMSQATVHLIVYQWRDNQFKKFTPIEVYGNLNTLIQTKIFDIENTCRNLWKPPLIPPIKTNVTYVQGGYAIDGWPVYVPEGQWKIELHFYLNNKENPMAVLVVEVNTIKPLSRG